MSIQIKTYILGPLQNNTYLVIEKLSGDSVIIDPAIGSQVIIDDLKKNHLTLRQILILPSQYACTLTTILSGKKVGVQEN